jgi:hypothetical protein
MPDPKKNPDVKTFLEDPAFQGERDLFTALINKELDARIAAEKKKREEEEGNETSIFDRWFGPKTPTTPQK